MAVGVGLDPFQNIVAVQWGGITKLDWLNHRYQVAGKKQLIADVIDHPEYRVAGQGLDLRGRNGSVVDADQPLRIAKFKNKDTSTVTTEKPGALNEFLFGRGTFVFEFDLYDAYTAYKTDHGEELVEAAWEGTYANPDDPDDPNHWWVAPFGPDIPDAGRPFFVSYAYTQERDTELGLQSAWEIKNVPAEPDITRYGEEDHDFWELMPGFEGPWLLDTRNTIDGVAGHAWNDWVTGQLWYRYDEGSVTGAARTVFGWWRNASYQYSMTSNAAYMAASTNPNHIDSANGTPPYYNETNPRPGDLPYGMSEFTWDNQPDEEYWIRRPVNQIVAYSAPQYSDDGWPTSLRTVPSSARWDVDRFPSPSFSNGLTITPAPGASFTRVRVAINYTLQRIQLSWNGSDVLEIEAASGFALPRKPPSEGVPPKPRKFWKATDPVNSWLSGYLVHRCLWHYRTAKTAKQLKKMSVIKPLPLATDKDWTTKGISF